MSVQIIGGGPAGLAAGYYAKRSNIPIKIFEGSNEIGGNCRTLSFGEFKYDTGAHRFHDKNNDVTKVIKNLLGDELIKVDSPSTIFWNKKHINFPLEFSNLFKNLDKKVIVKIIYENIINILLPNSKKENFKDLAYKKYGETLSELFLINYTKKLWGENAQNLLTNISGNRINNLDLSTMIKSFLTNGKFSSNHLDGSFYYPQNGIGEIFYSVANYVGYENIYLNSKVSELQHNDNKINKLVLDNNKEIEVDNLISTMPLNMLIKSLNPLPAKEIINEAKKIKFRALRLAVFTLDVEHFSNNASIYYPQKEISFTRIYEPKNRSNKMAPKDKTCIVIEVPCEMSDLIYNYNDDDFINKIKQDLVNSTHINYKNILNGDSIKIPYAYPILDLDLPNRLLIINNYLQKFNNLTLLGRNAEFKYLHIHNLFERSEAIVKDKI